MGMSESSCCDEFWALVWFCRACLIVASLLVGICFGKWQGVRWRLIDAEQDLFLAEQEIRRLRLQLDLLVN